MKLVLIVFKSTFLDIQLSYTAYSVYSSHWSLMVYLAYSNLSTMFLQDRTKSQCLQDSYLS